MPENNSNHKEMFTCDYQHQILKIGIKLVKTSFIGLMILTVPSLILRIIYEGSGMQQVIEKLIFGVLVSVVLGLMLFIINTNLKVFIAILTYSNMLAVALMTEAEIKESPDQFHFKPDFILGILCATLFKQMLMVSTRNGIYSNAFNLAYYYIRNHMHYGKVPMDIQIFVVLLFLIMLQSSLLNGQYVQKIIELMIKDSENMKTQFKNTTEIIPNGVLVINVNSSDVVFSNTELLKLFKIDNKDGIKDSLKTFILKLKSSSPDSTNPDLASNIPINAQQLNQFSFENKDIAMQDLLQYLLSIKSNNNNRESLFKSKTLQKYVQVKAQFIDKDSQLIVIINDISRIKQIEKVSQQMKSMFFASIAHELRTPLNTIIPMSNRLMQLITTGKPLQYIKIIRNSAIFLQNIVEEALDMSRIENNKFITNNELFDVRKTIQDVGEVMEFQVQQKKLKFEIYISDNVPYQIASDEKRYQQILYNLIGNALKFTFQGYIKLRVDFENDFLITVVEDSGIGIEEDQISKLFKFFGTIKKSNKINRGGMGFGLTISKMILQQLNGDISVQSQQSQGSKFTFRIKIDQAQSSLIKDFEIPKINIQENFEIEPNQSISTFNLMKNEEEKKEDNKNLGRRNFKSLQESCDFVISPRGANFQKAFGGLEYTLQRDFLTSNTTPKSQYDDF